MFFAIESAKHSASCIFPEQRRKKRNQRTSKDEKSEERKQVEISSQLNNFPSLVVENLVNELSETNNDQ